MLECMVFISAALKKRCQTLGQTICQTSYKTLNKTYKSGNKATQQIKEIKDLCTKFSEI